MQMICVHCGNFKFFEIEVEGLKAIETSSEGLIVDDAIIDDWNYSDEQLRDNLDDIINLSLRDDQYAIQYNSQHSRFEHADISCARCGSYQVCIPCRVWTPPTPYRSLDEELNEHHREYLSLRKERDYANHLQLL